MPTEILLDPCPGPDCERGLVAYSLAQSSPAAFADPAPDPAAAFPCWAGELLPWPLICVVLQNEVSASTGEPFLWRAVVTNGQRCLLVCPHHLLDLYRHHADRVFEIFDAQHDHILLDRIFAACAHSIGL